MSNRHQRNYRTGLLGMILVATVAGCATGNDLVRDGTLNVERVASERAKVSFLYVQQEPEGISVRGKVSKRFLSRGPIPGHVHIAVANPAGDILSDTRVKYMRKSVKARTADFYVQIPTEPPVGSILRVTHHASTHRHSEYQRP